MNETKVATFSDFEAKIDGVTGIVEGYASVFNVRDHSKDMVMPGAFTKSLAARGKQLVYLPSHDHSIHVGQIPGVPIDVREDAKGLYTKTKFFLDTVAGKDSFSVIQHYQEAGRPIGLSYTYRVLDSDRTSSGRNLKELDLFEYGHTAIPMLDEARTTSAKSDSNSMIHTAEVDHNHNHGDMIHSHGHVHVVDEYGYASGHGRHDHTAEQLKSFVHDSGVNWTKVYTESQREEFVGKGFAMVGGIYPIVDEADLKDAVAAWDEYDGSPSERMHITKRARDLSLMKMLPDDWRSSVSLVLIDLKASDLIKDLENTLGKTLNAEKSTKMSFALDTIKEILGQDAVADSTMEAAAKVKRELDAFLATIKI